MEAPFDLPACRRLLFPLLHAEKGRLRNAVANRVPASRWAVDKTRNTEHSGTCRNKKKKKKIKIIFMKKIYEMKFFKYLVDHSSVKIITN